MRPCVLIRGSVDTVITDIETKEETVSSLDLNPN